MVDFNNNKYCKDYVNDGLLRKKIYALRYLFDINKHLSKRKLLDIGCATGELMKVFNTFGYECQGIDICDPLIKIARKCGLNAKATTIEKEKYPDKTFDVITILSVLQYIEDKVSFLNEVRRILKDDGIVLIHCPRELVSYEELFKVTKESGLYWNFRREGINKNYNEVICKKLRRVN